MIRATANYGAVPQDIYDGYNTDTKEYNHSIMVNDLKNYLDTLLKNPPLAPDWLNGYITILEKNMGTPPASFDYKSKTYTPQTFAKDT